MEIKSNVYDCYPCKTYYYIVDSEGRTYHKDGKWRKKTLIQLWSYGFRSIQEAQTILNTL